MRKDMCLAFIPGVFATFALGLSFMSSFWCETIAFEPLMADGENSFVLPTRTFGPFYAKELVAATVNTGGVEYLVVGDRCVSLPDVISKDAKWKTTQAFAVITAIIGGVMLFWTWISPCFDVSNRFWKQSGFVYIFCSFTQGLTLLLLESNACLNNAAISSFYSHKCKWDWGTRTNISAVVFWFATGVLMIAVIPPAKAPERPPPETQTVTYNQNVDGTVEETNVVKGTYVAGEGIVNNTDPEEGAPTELA
mmetsp:Transcript_9918/g.16470  ORF Transcript_9918/g.16470 Transcript_9918/m.16470 type:complete len:251 (+) Transcript_9918:85-837(+)|eukprot:CAMPEP_0119014016 /NCGR_PEP_ID=MMETSP1176-20130426/9309_1 /TAXON_ID=265551 /ORGANISM="Synedropsis recta cf, Strain CCMP1620" /LENGTH=250 /DNA_ID=CAMNT_0006967149 /DNA_START=73 /DNA_END=825 /DNA_ORIENTATION=+